MTKLKVLRIIFMTVAKILFKITGKHRYMWLNHYLEGSGKSLEIPEIYHIDMLNMARHALHTEHENMPIVEGDHQKGDHITITIGWHHSTLYDGYGFQGRPELFYMIGGFTMDIGYVPLNGARDVRVSGEDVYDWHPQYGEDGVELWFTSPIGPAWAIALLRAMFGEEYFSCGKHSVTGEAGISNKLWHDMMYVGAKEFKTVFDIRADESSLEY